LRLWDILDREQRPSDDLPIYTAAGTRERDNRTISSGVPGLLLMERAGQHVAKAALELYPGTGHVAVVAGKGNNGGDGLVAARMLAVAGVPVRVVLTDARGLAGDAATNLEALRGYPVEVLDLEEVDRTLAGAGVVIDAVLGTGISGSPRGAAARAIEAVNRSKAPVVAVDVPSGLGADDGRAPGPCVEADITVTMGNLKPGLVLYPGKVYAGEVVVADIGLLEGGEPWGFFTGPRSVARNLPPRPIDAHKGSCGRLLVVAGSTGMTGAAALTAAAALRAGAGVVTLAVPASLNPILEEKLTEVMTYPLPEVLGGRGVVLSQAAVDPVLDLARDYDAVVLGPGLGREPETMELVRRLAAEIEVPLALDADGLVAFAGRPGELAARRAATVLTPHPGEAAILTGLSVREVQASRPVLVTRLADETGAAVLLKGHPTLAASPGEALRVNSTGGPALATAGSGDVLSGILGALLAAGVDPFRAAWSAAYIHGAAGDLVAGEKGAYSVIASDLVEALGDVLRGL